MLAANAFRKRESVFQKREKLIILGSVLLGLVYVIFNTLGTPDSYMLYHLPNLKIFDNYTPSLTPPFYGREVTIAVQISIGLILFIFSTSMLAKIKLECSLKDFLSHKIFLINLGILIFALSFIYGSIAKQWWVYYGASVVSALFFGWSVLKDTREVYNDYENLIPFIKEDILNNLSFSESSRVKLRKMLRCLKKSEDPDTFMMIQIKGDTTELVKGYINIDTIQEFLKKRLDRMLGNRHYLMLPLSNRKIGIVLKILHHKEKEMDFSLEHLEGIMKEIHQSLGRDFSIGIGRSYKGLESLYISYQEAQNALDFSESLSGSQIIHVENLTPGKQPGPRYPVKEKKKLLGFIKVGDRINALNTTENFLSALEKYISESPGNLQVRLYEITGSIIDTAVLAGGDEDKLNHLALRYFKDIEHIQNINILRKWMKAAVRDTVEVVCGVYESRSRVLIEKAENIIYERFSESSLNYKDVAGEIFISPSYFMNLFKKETGETFVDYLRKVRIEKAKEFLLNTQKSITAIAMDVGFNNPNYFSSQFTKTVGQSAKNYRKQWTKEFLPIT